MQTVLLIFSSTQHALYVTDPTVITNGDEDEVFARLDENGFVIFITCKLFC